MYFCWKKGNSESVNEYSLMNRGLMTPQGTQGSVKIAQSHHLKKDGGGKVELAESHYVTGILRILQTGMAAYCH